MTSARLGTHAAVIGASIGGLAAAAALAPFFERVTLIEKDRLPAGPSPRTGVPQGRHLHIILAGGLRALETLLPGFTAELAGAGAIPLTIATDIRFEYPGYDPFPARDLGLLTYSMTRPLLERVVLAKVLGIANVGLRDRTRVLDLLTAADSGDVTGVRAAVEDGGEETIAADLVIDASGRSMLTLALLDRLGRPRPEVTEIGIDITYATTLLAMTGADRGDMQGVLTHPVAPESSRVGVLMPVEGGRWLATMAGMHTDTPPADHAGFMNFAAGLRTRTIHDRIGSLTPLTDIARFRFPASVRRHFERTPDFPRGLLPFGDSLCRFNPLYGQGMSVRAQEAVLLGRTLQTLATAPDPLGRLAATFLSEAQTLNDAPWLATVPVDLSYPHTTGERPADHAQQLQFGAALRRLAAREADMHLLMTEVMHMLKPRSALREPAVFARIRAEMAAG